ncbi:hypothetical protein CAOG_010144 [Capsaspora owczarzaki ATCC 30864]|uniref:Uncharacterized protein n=1 Tax=Capsaspora owczarzaki (strain ATCC 30864) TaxID=595528 RepID=A0A0D2W0B3_CAPO3|nr:hypothetical protein CAOG_010144 [Capsaspora owczarzaki ATCC 30864]
MAANPGGGGSGGSSGDGSNIDWQLRCKEAERALESVQQQAGKIREWVSKKVRDMENTVFVTEDRAAKTESKLLHTEQQLRDSQRMALDLQQHLARSTQEADEQKRTFENKAKLVREYVDKKLGQLEQENRALRHEQLRMQQQQQQQTPNAAPAAATSTGAAGGSSSSSASSSSSSGLPTTQAPSGAIYALVSKKNNNNNKSATSLLAPIVASGTPNAATEEVVRLGKLLNDAAADAENAEGRLRALEDKLRRIEDNAGVEPAVLARARALTNITQRIGSSSSFSRNIVGTTQPLHQLDKHLYDPVADLPPLHANGASSGSSSSSSNSRQQPNRHPSDESDGLQDDIIAGYMRNLITSPTSSKSNNTAGLILQNDDLYESPQDYTIKIKQLQQPSGGANDDVGGESSSSSGGHPVVTSTSSGSLSQDASSPAPARMKITRSASVDASTSLSTSPPARLLDTASAAARRLNTCSVFTSENLLKETVEMSGFLTKQGGTVKSWRRRWFVLADRTLMYYKAQSDVSKNQPLGRVPLNGFSRIAKNDTLGKQFLFEIFTPRRTYYLSADTEAEMKSWLQVLQNVLKRTSTIPLALQSDESGGAAISGWMTKVKRGSFKRRWFVLLGKVLYFYRTPQDSVPLGEIYLLEATVETINPADDSDHESDAESFHCFGISTRYTSYHFVAESAEEKDRWMYHIVIASNTPQPKVGTETERLIAKLDGNPDDPVLNNPALTFTKEPITESLITLPSRELEQEAVNMFKALLLYTGVVIDLTAVDYHLSLAQNIITKCLARPELRNELFCQLIRQTNKHPYPNSSLTLQCWHVLAIACGIFLPSRQFLEYLNTHLTRHGTTKTESGKFALYCQRCVRRTEANGHRTHRPSRMEVASVILRNPYDHSFPMSIPVLLPGGQQHIVGFDPASTVEEMLNMLNRELRLRPTSMTGFALFCRDPIHTNIDRSLKASTSIGDVLGLWERQAREHKVGLVDQHSSPVRLGFRRKLYFKSLNRVGGPDDAVTDPERLLLFHQAHAQLMDGKYPVTESNAIELGALQAQFKHGDLVLAALAMETRSQQQAPGLHSSQLNLSQQQALNASHQVAQSLPNMSYLSSSSSFAVEGGGVMHSGIPSSGSMSVSSSSALRIEQLVESCLREFIPVRLLEANANNTNHLVRHFQDKWQALRGMKAELCLPTGPITADRQNSSDLCWMAVNEKGLYVLDYATMKLKTSHEYRKMLSFGNSGGDFVLVVHSGSGRSSDINEATEKLRYGTNEVREVTSTIADYINAIVRREGIVCDATEIPSL